MNTASKPAKYFSVPLIMIALVAIYTGISPAPALACGAPTSTQLFCSAAGTAPPGFGSTFQNNLTDPLGGQCTAGGPGCTNDTFVDPGIGDCTDGSTGCNAGGDLLLPTSNDPCISCFAEPGQVTSLTGGEDRSLQPARDYLADQRSVLAAQRAAFDRSNEAAENVAEARRQNTLATNASKARIKDLKARLEALPRNASEEDYRAIEGPLAAEETKLDGLQADRRKLDAAQDLADENVAVQAELVGNTQENIDSVERTGQVPATPGGFLTQFGGGGEATQSDYRLKGGEDSSYNKAVAGGKGYTFEPEAYRARAVDWLFDGTVGSQFLRSTSGHATVGENLSAGTIAGAEAWDKPFLITYLYMKAGLQKKLADAVRRGDIPGTIEVVRNEDDPGGSTREVVTILPEGLEAAKPYLDAADSLFEGMIEEEARTTSDEERDRQTEQRERDNEDFKREAEARERKRQQERRANPVPAKDVQDNIDPDGFKSVIDEVQGIVSLA